MQELRDCIIRDLERAIESAIKSLERLKATYEQKEEEDAITITW